MSNDTDFTEEKNADFGDLTSKSRAESAPEGKMTRPSVPLRQCWGHHDDGWRDDSREVERRRERDYVGEATELHNCLCNGGGVTHTLKRYEGEVCG